MRRHSLGSTGRPDLSKLAEDFRAARARGDPSLQGLQTLGAVAKQTGKKRTGGRSAFAPTSRQVFRQVLKRQREALWLRTHHLDAPARAMSLADDAAAGSLQEAVATAKRQVRLDGEESRRQAGELQAKLASFRGTTGERHLTELKQTLPDLALLDGQLHCVPAWSGCSVVWPSAGSESASKVAAFASHSKATNCSRCLQTEWDAEHTPIPQPSARLGSATTTGGLRDRCREAGLCLHQQEGATLSRFRASVLRVMKATFLTPEQERLLTSATLVMHFSRTDECAEHSVEEAGWSLWMHVGLDEFQTLSTYLAPPHTREDSQLGRD